DRAVALATDRDDVLAEGDVVAGGQQQRPRWEPALALGESGVDEQDADPERVIGLDVDLDGADERVALVAGVLAGGIGQLAAERAEQVAELGGVVRRDAERERVRHQRAPVDADGAVRVDLALELPAELDRAEASAEQA